MKAAVKERLRERVRQVVDVLDSGDEPGAAGDLKLALERFVDAEGRLRDLVAEDPDEPAHVHTLGSTL